MRYDTCSDILSYDRTYSETYKETNYRVSPLRFVLFIVSSCLLDVEKFSQSAVASHQKHEATQPTMDTPYGVTCSWSVVTHLAWRHGRRSFPVVLRSPHGLTHVQSDTPLLWSSPAGLPDLSWDNMPWGNEELEGRKEVSWRFKGFNSWYCHPGKAMPAAISNTYDHLLTNKTTSQSWWKTCKRRFSGHVRRKKSSFKSVLVSKSVTTCQESIRSS